jgi:putative FmdB family regulatory protein
MPLYSFQCQTCGLRFEKRVGMAERAKQPCECGQQATQAVPEDLAFNFNQPTTGILPQNTGIASLDTSYDRVIAQDAAQKWEGVQKRDQIKRAVLRDNPNATKADLSKTHEGSYRVMKPQERRAAETARALDAVATLEKRKHGPDRASWEGSSSDPA